VLLTSSVLLGIVVALRVRGGRWPRFAVASVHRNLTLLSICFVTVHVVTTVADGYAPISLVSAVVPFTSPYRRIWLGLGAIAFDLLLALVATSLARALIAPRLWRAVHWLAYATWPIALVHSLGTGSDARLGWLSLLGLGCLAAVAVAVLVRVAVGVGDPALRLAGATLAVVVAVTLGLWYQSGPARQGWAKRAGTPASLIARGVRRGREVALAVAPPGSFVSALSGTVRQEQARDGLVTVHLSLRLRGGPGGAARIELRGEPAGEGVALTASGVSFVPATTRAVYTGSAVGLAGSQVVADVRDAAGDRLRLAFDLRIDAVSKSVAGVVSSRTGGGEG